MMNTLTEEEEKAQGEESDSLLHNSSQKPILRLAADTIMDEKSPASELRQEMSGSFGIPKIQEIPATPPQHRRDRRHSAFESMFQVFRRPSATFDAFSGLRRSSGSRRGSHTNLENHGRATNNTDMSHKNHQNNHRGADSGSNGALVPAQHQVEFHRPSLITFHPDHINANQKRYIMGLLHSSSNSLPELCRDSSPSTPKKTHMTQYKEGNDVLITTLSAFYAKILITMGIAFPVTQVLSTSRVPLHFYQGFYLFLYLGSLAFMSSMYVALLKDKALSKMIQSSFDVEDEEFRRFQSLRKNKRSNLGPIRYGSFYLRLGAVAFGIGSMVYSGLEFGQYFELKSDNACSSLLQAFTPVTRMILTLIQMQFIFLNSQMAMSRASGITKFGLMHLIATNLCEWLYVIVEETKHEIVHLRHLGKSADDIKDALDAQHHERERRHDEHQDMFECRRANVMGSMVQDAAPFLFPCTIEYSLICAVIMYEMWKDMGRVPRAQDSDRDQHAQTPEENKLQTSVPGGGQYQKPSQHFSVDCSNAHKGLFAGIFLIVLTIISLIMFFVMHKDEEYRSMAVYQVNITEMIAYSVTLIAVVAGGWQIMYLNFDLKERLTNGIGLDNTLLLWAQSGLYIYCMFSITSSYFMTELDSPGGILCEVFALVQATCQTVFILDGTFRRTETQEQSKRKPGREIVTFLLVANMALWLIFTLQKSRAEFRPTHLEFFGVWAWTIITHVSMPLAIFYRFHSTICLFEIWKDAYKFKPRH